MKKNSAIAKKDIARNEAVLYIDNFLQITPTKRGGNAKENNGHRAVIESFQLLG